jgi:hypothetical protein
MFEAHQLAIIKLLGEQFQTVHCRPIWHVDEKRLLEATSACHHGLQQRALIRLNIRSG